MVKYFVGNIPFTTSEDQLAMYFESVGCIGATVSIGAYADGKPKGFAILTLAAEFAGALDGEHEVEGRKLVVRLDRGPAPSRLHVSSLAWETTDEALFEFFSTFSVPRSAVVMMHADSGRSKGWGLVTFRDGAAATAANEAFATTDGTLDGRQIRVKLDGGAGGGGGRGGGRGGGGGGRGGARSGGGGGRGGGGRGGQQRRPRFEDNGQPIEGGECAIVITNLPWSMTDEDVGDMLEGYDIASAEVQYGDDGRSRGYARVTTTTKATAQSVIGALNGWEVEGRAITVKVRTTRTGYLSAPVTQNVPTQSLFSSPLLLFISPHSLIALAAAAAAAVVAGATKAFLRERERKERKRG